MTATSRTSGSFPPDEAVAASLFAAPWSASEETKPADVPEAEPSIWEQNGQAVATMSAPVDAASTINYEIVTGLGAHIPRAYRDDTAHTQEKNTHE